MATITERPETVLPVAETVRPHDIPVYPVSKPLKPGLPPLTDRPVQEPPPTSSPRPQPQFMNNQFF